MTSDAPPRTPLSLLRALSAGFALPFEALALLRRERALWPLASAPIGIATLALAAVLFALALWFPELRALFADLLPELRAEAWYAWLWVGPARVVLWLLGWLLLLMLSLVGLLFAFVLAGFAAAPFLDALSLQVEQMVARPAAAAEGAGLRALLRGGVFALREELRRLLFFVGVWLALACAGLLLPGAQLLVAPALLIFTLLFLTLDYTSYHFDRQHLDFAAKRNWLRANWATAIGFGAAAATLCAVPGLNLLALPVLATAGTLLALRYPPV